MAVSRTSKAVIGTGLVLMLGAGAETTRRMHQAGPEAITEAEIQMVEEGSMTLADFQDQRREGQSDMLDPLVPVGATGFSLLNIGIGLALGTKRRRHEVIKHHAITALAFASVGALAYGIDAVNGTGNDAVPGIELQLSTNELDTREAMENTLTTDLTSDLIWPTAGTGFMIWAAGVAVDTLIQARRAER